MRCYVDAPSKDDVHFCLYFKPDKESGVRSINVLPDFIKPGILEIDSIYVDGVLKPYATASNYQIEVREKDAGKPFVVRFRNINPIESS